MARLGKSIAKQSEGRAGEKYLPVGGQVRKLCAVKDGLPAPSEKLKNRIGVARRPQSEAPHALAWLGIELEKSVQLACLQRCSVDGWDGEG
jgi:hypothetical protein